MLKNAGKHPKGYWMGIGISIGVAIGVALGPLFENSGVGIAIGIAIGSGIGASLERKNKDKIRPLTDRERKRQKVGVIVGLILAALSLAMLLGIYFQQAR